MDEPRFNLAVHHNAHVRGAQYSRAFVRGGGDTVMSTGYTSMVLLPCSSPSPLESCQNTVLICYDRLGNGWDCRGPWSHSSAV
jgi:hypothetical protein